MKTDKQITGITGTSIVQQIVNEYWKSDYQKVDHENDDAIDAIIHLRKDQELTGECIYAQIKSGDGYKVVTQNRPESIGINVGSEYITAHRPRWNNLMGAVILVFVDDQKTAYWTDLKSDNSYTIDNRGLILIPKIQRFGAHSKGHFKRLGGLFLQDRHLTSIRLERSELDYLRIDRKLNESARGFYKIWAKAAIGDRTNPGLGEVKIGRCGWRHISRKQRGYDKIFQSWQLLSVARRIIQEVDRAYQITKTVSTTETDEEYILKDFISLRAKIIFPNRHESVVQVILRRKKKVNKITNTIDQEVWFYSVYEPRRAGRV